MSNEINEDFLKRSDINLEDVNLYADYPLITCGTGSGKTHFATTELRLFLEDYLNIKIDFVLFLVPTNTIKTQLLNDYCEYAKELCFEELYFGIDEDKRIRVCCFGTLATFIINNGYIPFKPNLIIVDEVDELIKWSKFFYGYVNVWNWININRANSLFCGLTATPQILIDYVSNLTDFNFVDITPNFPNKYKVENINIISHSSVRTYLKAISPSIDNKYIIYLRSAKLCYELSRNYQNSAFLISPHNVKRITENGKPLNELMEEQKFAVEPFGEVGLRDYVLTTHQLPPQINILFINDSALTGMNINDLAVNHIAAESVDIATLIQAKGRIRHNLKTFNAIYNFSEKENIEKMIDTYNELAINADNKEYLRGWYGREQAIIKDCEDKQVDLYIDILTFKDSKDEVSLNPFCESIYQYEIDLYSALSGDTTRKTYFHSLLKHTDNPLNFIDGRQFQAIAANNLLINQFNIDKWINRKLFKEDKDELASELAVVDKQRHKRGWTTAKKLIIEAGYSVKDSNTTINGKKVRYSYITK